LELAGQALEALPAGDLLSRARVYGALGIAYEWAGRLAEASQAFEQAELLAQQIGVRYLAISVSCDQAWIQVKQGQIGRARQRGEQALQLAQVAGVRIPPAAHPCAVLAEIALEQNDLTTAEAYASESLELGRQGELANSLRVGYSILARVKLAQGDSEGALAAIEQADQIVRGAGVVHMIEEMAAYRARVWLAQGRLDEASQWAQMYERSRTETVEYLREFSELTLAQLRLAENRPVEALSLLDSLLPEAQAQNRVRPMMEMQLGRALAWQTSGQPDKALAALEHALALAEPEEYVRVFLDRGPRLKELLERLPARQVSRSKAEFIQKLLSGLPDDKSEEKRKPLRPSPKAFAPEPAIDPLSEQELAVLRLLADGLSNQEIADRLFISLGTAKWHVHNLHGKLGVKSRTQAAARARELDLI
jgi:LuxR family maltose regulon positive regulatory protein